MKGRSHTVEKRKSSHPHKLHATSQPSRFSHTHAQTQHTTSIAINSAPYTSHQEITTGTANPVS